MRINDFRSDLGDVCVRHNVYNVHKVITKDGAIFDSLNTQDLRNMSIACSILFDNNWEMIAKSEFKEDEDKILSLQYNKPKIHLRIIKI